MDNMRPHHAKITQLKLEELKNDRIPHPPYSPDISPCGFLTLRSLEMFCRDGSSRRGRTSKTPSPTGWSHRRRSSGGEDSNNCRNDGMRLCVAKENIQAQERLNCSYFNFCQTIFEQKLMCRPSKFYLYLYHQIENTGHPDMGNLIYKLFYVIVTFNFLLS